MLTASTLRGQSELEYPPQLDITRNYDPCIPSEPFDYPEPENTERICDNFPFYIVSAGGSMANGTSTQYNPGALIENINFDVLGAWTITAGSGTLTFRNCNFRAAPAAVMHVKCPDAPSAEVTILFENCNFFSCDTLWHGIRLYDSDNNPTAVRNNFRFVGCGIEDAVTGVLAQYFAPSATVLLDGNNFNNNYIGFTAVTDFVYAPFTLGCLNNVFMTNQNLRPKASSMGAAVAPDWPMAYAGVFLQGYNATIGRPGTSNLFTRMENGLVGSLCAYRSLYNNFDALFVNGIMSWHCHATINNNNFSQSSAQNFMWRGVFCDGDDLTAHSNFFSGHLIYGIQSQNNMASEQIEIYNNNFQPSYRLAQYGIYVQRPAAVADPLIPAHVKIYFNVCSSDASDNLALYRFITVENLETASDDLEIFDNEAPQFVFLQQTQPFFGSFVAVFGPNGDNHHLLNNTGHLTGAPPDMTFFGIQFSANNSSGNHIDLNQMGGEPSSSATYYSMYCGIHADGAGSEINLCENVVNKSYNGLHFREGNNYPQISENSMDDHAYGMHIEANAQLGDQLGRGNNWGTGIYVEFAAKKEGSLFSTGPSPMLLTRFWVPEDVQYPFLPPGSDLEPNPDLELIVNRRWFLFTPDEPQAYCEPISSQSQLTSMESLIAEGNSGLSGAALWDEETNLYLKLLEHPSWAPSGSAAATFLSNNAGTSVGAIATFKAGFRNATRIPSTEQVAINQLTVDIESNTTDLETLLIPINYNLDLASPTEKSQIAALEADNTGLLADLADAKSTLLTQRAADLAGLETLHAALPELEAIEAANKSLQGIYLSMALGNPLSSTQYSILKGIADQNPDVIGHTQSEAAALLGACEQAIYSHEISAEQHNDHPHQNRPVEKIQVAPNPASDQILVTLPQGFQGLLQLLDMTGKVIQTMEVPTDAEYQHLDLNARPNGLYQLSLINPFGGVRMTQTISIQH